MDNEVLKNEMKKRLVDLLPTPVMAVDNDMNIIYVNEECCGFIGITSEDACGKKCYDVFQSAHCKTDKCCMKKSMNDGERYSDRNHFSLNDETAHIEYYTAPLKDEKNDMVGGIEFIMDITDKVQNEERLLEQSDTIRKLSTPTIKLWDGILVLPIVGILDSLRAQFMMESMLDKIMETSSKVIVLDIQGVAAVDTAVANHILKITSATRLMGCECLISGISPAVAQTIVQLGIDMGSIKTHSDLSSALAKAFEILNLKVTMD